MASQFSRTTVQKIAMYGITNNTPPTFSGITSAVAQSDGSVLVSWGAASGGYLSPVRYVIYISPGSVSDSILFSMPNKIESTMSSATSLKVYVDSNGNTLVAGNIYTFGVRAVSASNISDNNIAILTTTITYNLYALVQSIPGAVWDENLTTHNTTDTAGSDIQQINKNSRTAKNILIGKL